MRGPTGTIGGGIGRAGISIFPLGLCEKVLPVTEKKCYLQKSIYCKCCFLEGRPQQQSQLRGVNQ